VSSYKNLCGALAPLRIYALGRGGLIDCELLAYGAGFDLLSGEIAALKGGVFPQTAVGGNLALFEGAVGLPVRPGASVAQRQALVLRRMLGPFPPTLAGVEEALATCGLVDPQVEETALGLVVSARGVAPAMEIDDVWTLCLRALPAHLPALVFGQDWDARDLLGRKWDDLDALGRSWTELAFAGVS